MGSLTRTGRILRSGVAFGMLLLAGIGSPARGGVDRWTATDPGSDLIQQVVVDPRSAQTAYAVSLYHGIFKTITGGGDWMALGGGLPAGFLGPLVLAPGRPSGLYLGAEGLWRSPDGGASWERLDGGSLRLVHALAVGAGDPPLLYAAGQGQPEELGLFRSADGGASWERVRTAETFFVFRDIEAHPVDPATVFVASTSGLEVSRDGGASWQLVQQTADGQAFGGLDSVAISQADKDRIYASGRGRLFRSVDGGETWRREAAFPGVCDFAELVLDPSRVDHLLAVCNGLLYESTDGGRSWSGNLAERLPGLTSLAFAPATEGLLYAGTASRGVYKSGDGGRFWSQTLGRMPGGRFGSFALDAISPSFLYLMSAFDCRFHVSPEGGAWWYGLRPPFCFAEILAHPTLFGTLYANSELGLYRTEDRGASWSLVSHEPSRLLAVDPVDPRRLFADGPPGLLRSTDGGGSWAVVLDQQDGNAYRHAFQVVVDPGDPLRVYAAVEESIVGASSVDTYRSTDGGRRWEKVLPGGGELTLVPGSPSAVYAISYDPTHFGRLVRSTDGGDHWELADLPGERLVAVGSDPPTLYTYSGSEGYRSRDRGRTWEPLAGWSESFPDDLAFLAAHPRAPDRVFGTSPSGGFFVNDLVGAEPLELAGGRFAVKAAWRTRAGRQGGSRPFPLRRDSGALWFFRPGNPELLLKLLDGQAINGYYWFFSGALTNLEYTVTVEDRASGVSRSFFYPQGPPQSRAEVRALIGFPDLAADPADQGSAPQGGSAGPCLLRGRFRVEVSFHRLGDPAQPAVAEPVTADSCAFWFFRPDNLELILKILDGRPVNGRFWVFAGGLTTLPHEITVRDLETGEEKSYPFAGGPPLPVSFADTEAFPRP